MTPAELEALQEWGIESFVDCDEYMGGEFDSYEALADEIKSWSVEQLLESKREDMLDAVFGCQESYPDISMEELELMYAAVLKGELPSFGVG